MNMVAVSIVIITKNQADILAGCLSQARLITNDIVIIDNGPADNPNSINAQGCRVFKKKWDGYGANKNKGIDAARYDWILSIDADEVPDDELIMSLNQLDYSNPEVVYDIKFRAYLGEKMIRFGQWGNDHHIRLFNRKMVRWIDTPVHETLTLVSSIKVRKTGGYIHHYSAKDVEEYKAKSILYASLSAVKYFNSGKRAGFIKLYISPAFNFLKNYLFYLGFLDGRSGWEITKITIKNTRRKYLMLNQLQHLSQKEQVYNDSFAIEY